MTRPPPAAVTAPPDPLGVIELTRDILAAYPQADIYALRIKGDSLIDALLRDGDIAILCKMITPEQDKMMHIVVEGGHHLRRVDIETSGLAQTPTGRLRLVASRDDTPEIWVEAGGDWVIRGRVVAVIRYV